MIDNPIPLFKVFMSDEASGSVSKVLSSGYITQGPEVEKFEEVLKKYFNKIYFEMKKNETKIIQEISDFQINKVDINGYYFPDYNLVSDFMRPSKIFNKIIESM